MPSTEMEQTDLHLQRVAFITLIDIAIDKIKEFRRSYQKCLDRGCMIPRNRHRHPLSSSGKFEYLYANDVGVDYLCTDRRFISD